MAEKKTHKVKITGIPVKPNSPPMKGEAGWYYEKAYPDAKTFHAWIPVGTTVEVDDATMIGWKKVNAVEFEALADDATVDVSIVQELANYEEGLIAAGKTVVGAPKKPKVMGKNVDTSKVEGVFKDSPVLGSDTSPKEKAGGIK